MSYVAGVALQAAVYQHLRDDAALNGMVGDAIYDAMPVDTPSGVYVSLGPDDAREAGDMTGAGSRHDFIVSVLSGTDESNGFGAVKEVAGAVSAALENSVPTLDHGHLVGLWFLRAKARRVENGEARRVDLTFRARIDLG